jgi:hydroxymethylpyrimidine pyrophosphatase-like HAD family hydrolase
MNKTKASIIKVMNMIIALIFDIDGSIMPQGGPIDPRVGQLFLLLERLGVKQGPATGKNCDYGRGLACGVGVVWDFIIGETGAQFLETVSKTGQPVYRQHKPAAVGNDLSIFARKIELDQLARIFKTYNQSGESPESYRPELKEGIITLFPPGQNIGVSEAWAAYFQDVVRIYRLNLKVQRHSDGCIDIVPSAVSKLLGVQKVCELYNCQPDKLLVVVDGINDRELTYNGTNVIAVSNAVDEIKEAAKKGGGFVATLPDGRGFAQGLKDYAERGFFGKEAGGAIIEAVDVSGLLSK